MTDRPYIEADWRGYVNFQCPRCPFATLVLEEFGGHSCRGEVRLAPDPMGDVRFSRGTKELATEAGFVASDFAGRQPSGTTGFTPSDIRAMLAEHVEE